MKWYDTMQFGIDWVSVTVDTPDLKEFLYSLSVACDLDFYGFVECQPLYFYKNGLRYAPANGCSIRLNYNLMPNGQVPVNTLQMLQHGINVCVSGDGCRYLDNHTKNGLQKFCKVLSKYPHKPTRVDTCLDIFDKDNPIIPLFVDIAMNAHSTEKDGHPVIKGNFKRTANYIKYIPNWDEQLQRYSYNVDIGGKTSTQGQCQIYDKKLETIAKKGKLAPIILDSVGCTDYWFRIEYRAKNEKYCSSLFNMVCNGSAEDCFFLMADNFFDVVSLDQELNSISRCDDDVVWVDFLGILEQFTQNAHFVQLTSTPYVSASVHKTVQWAIRNSAFLYKIKLLQDKFPEQFSKIMDTGQDKYGSSSYYAPFAEELQQVNSIMA